MINRLVQRVIYVLQKAPTLSEVREIKQVDDIEGYTDFIQNYPAIGIARTNERIEYQLDNRGIRHVQTTLPIRVYTFSKASPEAARKVLDILAWKVLMVLHGNPYLYLSDFDPQNFLINSDVEGIVYGSKSKDKVYYEYATLLYNTYRDVFDPQPDAEYYDVLKTMWRVETEDISEEEDT